MAYYIRDDRETPGYRGLGTPIISPKLTMFRDAEGKHVFIHAAKTVLHDACVNDNIPGVKQEGEYTLDRMRASHDARDQWAAQFGPGHALCWDRLWTNDPERAPDCYFCGEPVVGKG